MPAALPEAIPIAEPMQPRYEVAAQMLDRAVQAGCQDPNVLYMLAMAHKRQGKLADARNALARSRSPTPTSCCKWACCRSRNSNLAQAEGELPAPGRWTRTPTKSATTCC